MNNELSEGNYSIDVEDYDDPELNETIFGTPDDFNPNIIPDHQPHAPFVPQEVPFNRVPQRPPFPAPPVRNWNYISFRNLTEGRIIRDHLHDLNNCYVAIPIVFIRNINEESRRNIPGYIIHHDFV